MKTVLLPLYSRFQRGMTLLELMIVIAIVAILAALAVPSFVEVVRSNKASNALQLVQTSLLLARSESLKRGARVSMAYKVDRVAINRSTFTNGWDVFVDGNNNGLLDAGEQVLLTQGPLDDKYYFYSNFFSLFGAGPGIAPPSYVAGRPTSITGAISPANFLVGLSDYGSGGAENFRASKVHIRLICVAVTGRSRVIKPGDPGATDIAGNFKCPTTQ